MEEKQPSENELKGLCSRNPSSQDVSTTSSSSSSPMEISKIISTNVQIQNESTPKSEPNPNETTNTPEQDTNHHQIDNNTKISDSPIIDPEADIEMAETEKGYQPVSQKASSPADNKHRKHAHSVATPPPFHAKDISDPKLRSQWELFKEINKMYFYNPGQKTFGESIKLDSVGPWFFFVCAIIPTLYNAFFFGVVPIGSPESHRLWVLTLVITPMTMTAIAYLNTAAFLGCLGVERPFRVHWKILLGVYLTVAGVATSLVPFVGLWKMYGVAMILLTFFATFLGSWIHERYKIHKYGKIYLTVLELFTMRFKQYLKVMVCLIVFFFCLIGYIFAFEHSASAQKVVPFVLVIVTFIIRKTMLSLTDPFGLEIAMLISGFWVENMKDMVQLLAYPYVKRPIYYLSIWAGNFAGNVANLLFLTDNWFVFRVWIKAFLSRLFTCKPMCHPPEAIIEMEELVDERGHSNNKPGYHRRQVRFYAWKIISQLISSIFYLVTSTVLRFGFNKEHFPFARISEYEYHNTLIFASANLAFVATAGLVGLLYVRIRHPATWNYMVKIGHKLFFNHIFLGFVVAISACNGILALTLLVDDSKIYQYLQDDD